MRWHRSTLIALAAIVCFSVLALVGSGVSAQEGPKNTPTVVPTTPEPNPPVEPTQAPPETNPSEQPAQTEPPAASSPQNPQLLQTFCQMDVSDLGDDNPFTYQFSASVANNIASFNWNLGDSTTSTLQTVTHTYTTTGTFAITLICTPQAGFGGPMTLTGSITISSVVAANFNLTPATAIIGLPPFTISTVNSSTGGGLTYSWKISNSSNPLDAGFYTNTTENISYVFNPPVASMPITYWFHLVVTDGAGVSAGASRSVVFSPPPPKANFTLTPSDGVAPLNVTVAGVDLGGGPITTWSWDFNGDAIEDANGQGPHNYNYAAQGIFTITLTYTGPGGSGTFSRQVGVYPPGNPVQAIFTYQLTGNNVGGIEVCYTNQSTGPIATSVWNFGDGSPTLSSNDVVVCHLYATESVFTVTLSVANSTGTSTSNASNAVSVVGAPTAAFTVTPGLNIVWGTTINLNSSSSTGAITSRAWDFNGDGVTDSTATNPNNVSLTALGNNPIRLTVTGPGGTAFAEAIVVVARLEITCDFTGTLNVLPTAGAQAYNSVIGNAGGRPITYNWTITGTGTGLPMSFTTANINVNWAAIGSGAFQVTLNARTADGSDCSESKTVNRTWPSLNCLINDNVPNPLYANGGTYTFNANVQGLSGRTVLSYTWFVDGAAQGVTTASFNWTNTTSTAGLPATRVIRYNVLVDNGGGLTSDCYEERSVTIQPWPTLTCTNITGQAAPLPATPDDPTRNYNYTANIGGAAGRTVTYFWAISDGIINSPNPRTNNNQANVTWNATAGSFPTAPVNDNISVTVTAANPDGTSENCTMNRNVAVTIPRLTCGTPVGDADPVVGETTPYSTAISNILGRTPVVNPLNWELQEWDGAAWNTIATGTSDPFNYTFLTAGTQYRIRYTFAVNAAGSLPADNCTSPYLNLTVNTVGVNFQCDSTVLVGNATPNNPLATYAYTIEIDNGNAILLQYHWVIEDSANVDHDLGTTTATTNGTVTSPAFTLLQLAPLGIDINFLRVDVSAVDPDDSGYSCSGEIMLTVGTITVNYTYTGNNNAIAVGQDICLTNTSTTVPGDINSLTYTWTISGNPANNSWNSSTNTAQQPGCIYFTAAGSYQITLTGANGSGLRTGTRVVTFQVFGLQSLVITRSNQTFAPSNVTFTATGTNVSFPYSWEFRRVSDNSLVNSTNSNTPNVTQFFATADIYRVIVRANGPLGQTSAQLDFELIDVNQLRAAFTPSAYGGIAPLDVCFTDNSVGTNILTWSWDFDGDGTVDLSYNNIQGPPGSICHTYTTPGMVYSAQLTITNAMFTNTASNTIRTYTLMESSATFTISPQGGGQYCFTAVLEGTVFVTGWEYGDGGTGPAQNSVCHVYAASGSFVVSMHISDGTTDGVVVRPVVVVLSNPPAPILDADGLCAADRTASFTITNTGGAMTIPDQVVVRDNANNVIYSNSILLSANGSTTILLPDQSGTVTLSLTDRPSITASTVCNYPPEISVAAACNTNFLPVFTVTNARPADGPMIAPQAYDILNSANVVIATGTFELPLGVPSVDIAVPNGNNPYDTYTFASSGAVGIFNTPYNCAQQPVLDLDGICAGNIAFTITNTSLYNMVLPQTFSVLNGANQDVTPTPNIFQLNAGQSTTITLTGLNPYAGYTLSSSGFAGTISQTQNCAQPVLDLDVFCGSPLTFAVTNTGGDMLLVQSYSVTDSTNTVVATGNLDLVNGESETITLTGLDPYAVYTFTSGGFAATIDSTNDCVNPDLSVVSACSYPLTFTVSNNGGDMLEAQGYTVTNTAGDIVLVGSFMLANGVSEDIVLTDLDPYAGYTFSSAGFAGSLDLTQDCTHPALSATTTCIDPAEFVITNNGGDMLTPQTFSVTNAEGQDATPSPNSFLLLAGESTTVTLTGLNPYAGYTLSSDDFAGSLSITQPCQLPNLTVSADCALPASFIIENLGGDMLTDHSYRLLAASGEDVTPSDNTFRLLAGESIRVRVPAGVDVTRGIALTTDDLGIVSNGTLLCVMDAATEANGSQFIGLRGSLDLPDWSNVPTCGYSCPPFRLYHTDETGDWEIFRLDGADEINRETFRQNISQGRGEGVDDTSPSLSPNSEWVVFTSNRDGNWELYVAPLTDDPADQALGIQRLTYNEVAIDTDPAWGPNNFVVYETTRHGNWDLYMIDMTTGQEYRVTDSQADDINPYWSPDGSKVVFQSDRDGAGWQIYEFSLVTHVLTRLSDGTSIDVDPEYSPDGTRIVFRRYSDANAKSQLMLMDADGQNVEAITRFDEDATNAAWSPDNRLIAYQSDADGDLDIYIYEVATHTTRQLTDNTIPDYAPSWWCAPDRVLFTSDIANNPDIYEADATPMDAPAVRVEDEADQLTFENSMDIYPQASPAEENASREGQTVLGAFGEQTSFLRPETNLTPEDLSFDGLERDDWKGIEVCPAQ